MRRKPAITSKSKGLRAGKEFKAVLQAASEQLQEQFEGTEVVMFDKLDLIREFEQFRHRHISVPMQELELAFLAALSEAYRLLDHGCRNYAFVHGLLRNVITTSMGNRRGEWWTQVRTAMEFTMKSNKRAASGLLYLFTPFLIMHSDAKEISRLQDQFSKRRFPALQPIYIQRHAIIRFLLDQGSVKLNGTIHDPELSLAGFMHDAVKQKLDHRRLLREMLAIRSKRPLNHIAYLEELRELCELYGLKDPELIVLRELVVNDVFFTDEQIRRIELLCSSESVRRSYYLRLIRRLRKHIDRNLNKIIVLHNHLHEPAAILDLIKRYKGHFNTAHKAAIQLSPDLSREHMKVYLFQLLSALEEARESFHQKQLFVQVSQLLDRLVESDAEFLLTELLRQIGRNNYLHTLLKEYMVRRGFNLPA